MELKQISQALDTYIRPGTFPLAIKMVTSTKEIPEKTKIPKRDWGLTMPLCQGISIARRYGWQIAMGDEDMVCPLGSFTLGFLPAKTKLLDGTFDVPFWVKDQDARAKFTQSLPQMDLGRYTHLVATPLHRAAFEPQVIIIYGNAAQISRLVQAVVYQTGKPFASTSLGGFACGEEITKPMQTNQCQFIIASGGDRIVAQTQDHELSFAAPMSQVEMLIEGLEGTHKVGVRYPTPSYLMYTADFPASYSELNDYLRKED